MKTTSKLGNEKKHFWHIFPLKKKIPHSMKFVKESLIFCSCSNKQPETRLSRMLITLGEVGPYCVHTPCIFQGN